MSEPLPNSVPYQQPIIWLRLGAVVIDVVVAVIAVSILMLVTGRLPIFVNQILVGVVITGINWNFLLKGQTLGKKLLNLRIVRRDGSAADRMHIITRRILPIWLVSAIPYIGPLICLADALCIFRPGNYTLHDDLADTTVVLQS